MKTTDKNKMIVLPRNKKMVYSVIFLLCSLFVIYQNNYLIADNSIKRANDELKELFEKSESIIIYEAVGNFNLDSLQFKTQGLLTPIGLNQFNLLYPNDSLVEFYCAENTPVFIIGKVNNDYFNGIVTYRFYGQWLQTIDLITINNQYEVKGKIFLAGIGRDFSYLFDLSGFFESSNIFSSTSFTQIYEMEDFENNQDSTKSNCFKTIKRYLIENEGTVVLLDEEEIKSDCK